MLDRLSRRFLLCMVPLAAALLVGGCGDATDDADLILAEVGDRPVTAEYYQDRLARRTEANLPRSDDGQPMNMSSLEGKLAFLDVIIDKEAMVAKALQMGYMEDPNMIRAWNSLAESHGMRYFLQDHLLDPSDVTRAQVDHYYERLGESRNCRYLIAFSEAEASAARQALLDGASWSDVLAEYQGSPVAEGRIPESVFTWGEGREDIQNAVFALEEGALSEPVETPGGWLVFQPIEIIREPRPDVDLEQARSNIAQRVNHIVREKILLEIREQRHFKLDDEAVRIIMDGLPEGEALLDPETRQPVPRESLKPLQIPAAELDRVVMSYDMSSGSEVMTLGDYKEFYDVQNVFERPKKSAGLIALRSKVDEVAMRKIATDEMHRRGYTEDPRVYKDVFALLEERLVDRVNEELVQYDLEVSEDEILSYYQEHEESLWLAERRAGTVVRVDSLSEAQEVRRDWMDDALDEDLKPVSTGLLTANADFPVNMALFELEVGEFSEPIEVPTGWAVVRLDSVVPRYRIEMEEVSEDIIKAIRSGRQDKVLRQLLDEWRDEFGVTVHKGRLAKMPPWEEVRVASGRPL